MLYFAYGVNMNRDNMDKRCPGYRFVCRAVLAGYKIVYDGQSRLRGGGVANILPNRLEKVWGGLYEISENDLKKLDRFEGHPKYYQRKTVAVKDDQGQIHQAAAYHRAALTPNPPVASYRQEVLQGAEDCGLPQDYIKNNL